MPGSDDSTKSHLFNNSTQADAYKKYRPRYPEVLFDAIYDYAGSTAGTGTALDIATGRSGYYTSASKHRTDVHIASVTSHVHGATALHGATACMAPPNHYSASNIVIHLHNSNLFVVHRQRASRNRASKPLQPCHCAGCLG